MIKLASKRSFSNLKRFPRVLLVTAFVFIVPSASLAISLKEYHANVRNAVTALDTLAQVGETESTWDYGTRTGETIHGVRNLLPRLIAVEWDGQTFNVDNEWLHQELVQFSEAKYSDRLGVLKLITERLQALDERLTEAENWRAGEFGNKDEANRRLSTILARSEYAKVNTGKSFVARMLDRFLKWLSGLIPKPKPIWGGNMRLPSLIAQILVILIALAVIGYVLKLFVPAMLSSQRRGRKEKPKARVVLGEKLEPDQTASDLLAEAEELARRGELRAAIRKAYIALLVELAERKIFSLAQHKTNRDYLRAVSSSPPLHENMQQLTASFERHWYGLVNATENDWVAFAQGCRRTLS